MSGRRCSLFRLQMVVIALVGVSLLPKPGHAACTNCTTTTVGGDTVVTFSSGNGTFTPPSNVTQIQYLVVAGGGGGGGLPNGGNLGGAGGGGAGGMRTGNMTVTPGNTINVTVGAGGTSGVGGDSRGGNGGNSSLGTVTAAGGGGGASYNVNNNGRDGGSGGGGRVGGTGGSGITGQGNDGGDGGNGGAGGGGAGSAGADGGGGTGNNGGAGGSGQASSITGTSVTYAAGGDGGDYGSGGGSRRAGNAAAANTGNGGEGASGADGGRAVNGGAGGSGIVVVRYSSGSVGTAWGQWRMDEQGWNGTSGEVADASGNGNDGTAQGGATTAGASPAVPGDPGTCRYGTFDGTDDYVSVSNLSDTLAGTATLTFWIRTTQTGSDTGWEAPGVAGVEESGGADDIFWGWIDASGHIGLSVGNDFNEQKKSDTVINDDTWHHVALTRDASSGQIRIYIDGSLDQSGTSGTGTVGNAFSSIGRIENTGGAAQYFAGELDEVRVYDSVLSAGDVQTVYNATHACAAPPAGGSCSATFPSAVQNTDNAGSITFDFATSVDDPDNTLETANLNDNSGAANNSCGSTNCSATTPVAQMANVPSFQTATGDNDAETTWGNWTFALGQDGESDYDQVDIGFLGTLNDSGNFTTYRINELAFSFGSTWNVAGGADYYVDDLSLVSGMDINVTGSGTARIFVRGSVTFEDDMQVNAGGTPDNLIIVGYDDITLNTGGSGTVNALIYSQGDVDLGNEQQVNGSIAAEGDLTLGSNNSEVIYDQQAVDDVDHRGLCPSVNELDHYAIRHSGNLVSCDAESVTIEAHNGSDQAVDAGDTTINLSTSTGEGTWARVIAGSGNLDDPSAGDGAASYTFPDNGETMVTLAFNYTSVTAGSPETVNFQVAGGGASEDAGEDPSLTVSHSGLRMTDGSGNPLDVPPQIAGKPSDTAPQAQSLGLQAVRSSDSDPLQCEPAFRAGTTVEVELAAECRNPVSCAGSELSVTNGGSTTAVDTSDDNGGSGAASYEPVELAFGANAEAPLVLNYPDAGALQLHARMNPIDDGSGTPPVVEYIIGASNQFVVRPFGFHLDFDPDDNDSYDDRTVNGSCGAQTSCAADGSGDVFAVAGADFGVRLAAVVWESSDDDAGGTPDGIPDSNQAIADNATTPNFGNESAAEAVDITHTLTAPTAGSSGTFSGGAGLTGFGGGGFAAGTLVASGLRWSEVGIIDLAAALANGDYLGSGQDVTGTAPNVGRFIPSEFEVSVADAGMYELSCGGTFNYTGADFGYATGSEPRLTVTARNDTGTTTANYSDNRGGDFAKLVPAQVATALPSQDATNTGISGSNLVVNASEDNGSLTDNADGTLTYTFSDTDTFRYQRDSDARVAPFNANLPIDVTGVTDDDGVAASALPLTFTPSDPGAGGDVEIRFGRLLLDNAGGAEIAPVTVPVRTEYWDGTWRTNGEDDCTALPLATGFSLSNADAGTPSQPGDSDIVVDVDDFSEDGDDSHDTGETKVDTLTWTNPSTLTLSGGQAGLSFLPPGADHTGWIEVTPSLPPHLLGDWDDDGLWDDNPTARATFGIYGGNDRWIDIRRVPVN